MYLRAKMQRRALENLARYTEARFGGQRVTKGYALSEAVENYQSYVDDLELLHKAITESDIKDEGPGTPVNFNVRQEANESLNAFKQKLDELTGRSLFPAQVIDILLLCAASELGMQEYARINGEDDAMDFSVELEEFEKLGIEEQLAELYKTLLEIKANMR